MLLIYFPSRNNTKQHIRVSLSFSPTLPTTKYRNRPSQIGIQSKSSNREEGGRRSTALIYNQLSEAFPQTCWGRYIGKSKWNHIQEINWLRMLGRGIRIESLVLLQTFDRGRLYSLGLKYEDWRGDSELERERERCGRPFWSFKF